MGMRISEILHLAKAEVNLKRLEIDLNAKRVKTRKRRQVEIPIADDVLPLLQSAYHESEGLYIFPATFHHVPGQPIDWNQPQDDNSYVWRKVKAAAGVECRFHDLRHTAITNMVVRGMPETSIRQICGVEEDTMRRIYAHLKKELKTQFRGLFRGKFVE
jgi:integrase